MASNGICPAPPKPHVLMLPYPLQGHITPLMQLSKLLASRGFDITFVTTESNVQKLLTAKQELLANHLTKLGIRLVGIPDRPPDTPQADCMLDPEAFLASLLFMHTPFDKLVGRMVQEQGLHITCIISDSFLLWSQDVADKWHIPRVSFWPQSLTTFACTIGLPRIMEACPDLDPFNEQVYRSEASRVVNCIPGVPQLDASKLPFLTLGGEHSAEWLRQQVEAQIDRVNEPLCIVCNTSPDLEKQVHTHLKESFLSKPIIPLGLFLPSSFLGGHDGTDNKGTGSSLIDEDEECIQWLDMQRPQSVLYISLGSVAILEAKDAHEIAMGLEACQVPFLWVLRSAQGESTLAIQKSQGKVIRWAPQLRVLSHKAVGGFFTHCGWNSTLESISMGVPIIGWPQMIDQVTNCWFQVEKLEVGLRLELDMTNKVGRAGVQKAVRILMQEDEGNRMRMRASKYSSLVQPKYSNSLTSNLDSLVHTILSSHTSLPSLQSQS